MNRFQICAVTILAAIVICFSGVLAQQPNGAKHTEWVEGVLKDIQTVKVGMTRGQMLKIFDEEGGLSTRIWRTYVYRDCPYIKVDFEFEPRGNPKSHSEFPADVIIKISKPYLEYEIVD